MAGNRPRALLRLALARMTALRAPEKAALEDMLDDVEGLLSLSGDGLSAILERRVDGVPAGLGESAKRDLDSLVRMKARMVQRYDPEYPPLLGETARPPYLLYVRGELPDPGIPAIAIVGTRYPTGRGLETAARIAREAAMAGIPVISGLARGIDGAAHRGACAGGGYTAAVFGSGIDGIYPASHRDMARAILESGGGFISEYPPGTTPARYRFPERNRIIAGMSRACLVVEAPKGSGALITSAFALEEGRDVFVAGTCLDGPRASGMLGLVDDGAVKIGSLAEILDCWSQGSDRGEGSIGRDA